MQFYHNKIHFLVFLVQILSIFAPLFKAKGLRSSTE
jgi:hypothetical protein